MKRLCSILVILTILFGLVGCGAGDSKDNFLFEEDGIGDADFAPEADGSHITPSAGTLTAGEWKDVENMDFWKKLLNRNDWYQLMETRNLYANDIIPVFVHDADGSPCYNVEVKLVEDSETVYAARTDVNGKAWLLRNLSKTQDSEHISKVAVGEQSFDVPSEGVLDVDAHDAGIAVEALDLMLMIDTTGSMSDELSYLQKELEYVIERVADASKTLSINVSVNFYRDEEDEYIVRAFEFTSDIQKAIAHLNAQRADGGGDYPEAVHKALENAIKEHQWRSDAVKLMFFVLDAPPHDKNQVQGIDAQMTDTVKLASEKGIRIIPLASSGINTETEFLLRSWAVMTGGTYTFLTNHSGVGNDHLEPTVGEYQVEKLNECMIRIICEYCGLPYASSNNHPQ